MAAKQDNSNLHAKLALRRHFLRNYHADDRPHVLDCCQGEGVLWSRLRAEFDLASYWGVDLKPKKGRLKLDSVRILQQPGWPHNVIDVDTYGSPWRHWEALLPNVHRPTTVFLTIGHWLTGTDQRLLDAIGLGALPVPPGIACKLQDLGTRALLTMGKKHGIMLAEAVEAPSAPHARYVGVRLLPKRGGDQPKRSTTEAKVR